MPSKLRKAIGAVKDQTSISLAKVTNAENLEVLIIKATTHDEIPIEERYINEILSLVSSNKSYASACAQSIGKRIGKTKNWVVALKSLMIILRIFQDGDPYFPREVLHVMKGGSRILNLSGFRDDSSSSPWEYTAFVRLTALYLDERLDCFLTGKLQRRMTLRNHHNHQRFYKNHKMFNDTMGTKDMKPSMMLEKITFWQRLLDRALGTRPTGEAKTNRLVQISLYAIVQETFDIYRDISDGLAVILDSFFKLPYKTCFSAFQACVKSCKQFDELSDFYSFCLSIGVGRSNEYPKVQKISEELMETLQDFLRDQASNNTDIEVSNHNHHHHRRTQSSFHSSSQYSPLSKHLLLSSLSSSVRHNSSRRDEGYERSYGTSPSESCYETASENALSRCTSLEDLMIATDAGILAPMKFEPYYGGGGGDRDIEKQSENNDGDDDESSAFESCSNHSTSIDRAARSSLDRISFNGQQDKGDKDCWELVLAETITSKTEKASAINNVVPHHQYNPFLELDDKAVSSLTCSIDQTQINLIDMFEGDQNPSEPTRMAPTFTAQSSSFEADLTSIFGDLDSNTSCEIPAGSSSLQDVTENNLALVPCFQKNNHGMNSSSTSIFQSQGSFKTNSASSSHGYELYQRSVAPASNSQDLFKIHNTYQMSTRPTFNSQNSFKNDSTSSFHQNHDSQNLFRINSAPSSLTHVSYNSSIVPTFYGHNSYQTTLESTFQGYNSHMMGTTPTSQSFRSQTSYQASIQPTFHTHNPNQVSAEPNFQANNSFQTSNRPIFQNHSSHNSYQTNTYIVPSFHAHNTNQNNVLLAQPTFHAKVSNDEPLSEAPKEDDLFESWPSSLTNDEDDLSKSMQNPSLEQQKQVWLEQQKRIIDRHILN